MAICHKHSRHRIGREKEKNEVTASSGSQGMRDIDWVVSHDSELLLKFKVKWKSIHPSIHIHFYN